MKALHELGTIRRLADGLIAKAAKRAEETAAHTFRGDRSAAELCARAVGVSPGEAKRAIATAEALEALPATDAAVRAGRLSARQAELVAAAAADDPSIERELLEVAARGTVPLRDAVVTARARREDEAARAARQHRARFHRSWTTPDGMVEGRYQVTPEVGGAMKARLDADARRIFREHRAPGAHEPQEAYAADALAEAVLGEPVRPRAGTDPGADPPAPATESPTVRSKTLGYTTHVLIDHAALRRGHALPGETCEIPGVGPVNVAWVRSLLGDAFVTAVVKKGRDITTVAHLGRHIPAELRTALLAGGRECVVEGCSGRAYLEIDHSEIDHAKGGPTALWNLDWECSVHHRLKTQGWRLGPPHPTTGKRRLDPPTTGRAAA